MFFYRALILALLLALVGCEHGPSDGDGDGDADADGDADGDGDADADDGDADTGPDVPFAVTGVSPSHGIFSGFTQVTVRGRGFEPTDTVAFGDGRGGWTDVVAAAIEFVDENRINVLSPPGPPDSWVDVRVTQGDSEALLSEGCPSCDGFYYDPCQLAPDAGSIAGGTYVVMSCSGTEFDSGLTVTFDGVEAEDVDVISQTEIHLRTPPGTVGPADVEIDNIGGNILLAEAYNYFENSDPSNGGLGGDPIDGNIEVVVLDGATGAPLPDSFVIVGHDGGTEYQGRTSEDGAIVFSGPDIAGRQLIITVSHGPVPTPMDYDCDGEPETDMETLYETASFTEFDATYVTVILMPIPPPPPMCPGPMPEGVASFVQGELIFESMGEFGPYDWEIVPATLGPDEVKLTYVATTAPDIFFDPLRGEMLETGTIPGGRCAARECQVDADCRPFRNEMPCGAEECPYINAICNRFANQCMVPSYCESDADCSSIRDAVCDTSANVCITPDECNEDGDCDEFDGPNTEASCDLANDRCVIVDVSLRATGDTCVADEDCEDEDASCDDDGQCVVEQRTEPRSVIQVGRLVQRGYVVIEDGTGRVAFDGAEHDDAGVVGENGFTYCLSSRFGAVAVYAISGILNTATGEFVPWAFGIRRGVLVPPDETVSNIDIMMVTPLNQPMFVGLDDPPTPVGFDSGPNRFIVESFIDLGVEGVIWRRDRQSIREFPTDLHPYVSWLPREGGLSDATLTVAAYAYSFADVNGDGEEDLVYPFSVRFERGITDWVSDVMIGDWIGMPHPEEPDYGGTVEDNYLAWDNGPGDIHFTNVRMTLLPDGIPYWDFALPGEQADVTFPPIPSESAVSGTQVQFDVWHHRVGPGFEFDRFAYSDYNREAQTAYAANAWLINLE